MQLAFYDSRTALAGAIWRSLEAQVRPVYFLTWAWMENWLATLPRDAAPELAVFERGGQPVAACFLARRWERRHRVVMSRVRYLNATGLESYDDICLEHNALLATDGVSLADLIALLPRDWDELRIAAADRATLATLAATPLGDDIGVRIDREVACHQVDLAKVRASGYVELLGSSTRAQLRKARRAAGDIRYEVATDSRHALSIFDELVALHQQSWHARGQPGAFADPWFVRFHRRLVEKRIEHGELQLIRARNADGTLGCLYNLVAAGRVLFYQSGFAAPADRHIKPGYLCHAFAIEHAAEAGHAIYDLLGGDARYKQSLATDQTRLVWGRVQRKRLRFAVEDRARAWLRAWSAKRSERSRPESAPVPDPTAGR